MTRRTNRIFRRRLAVALGLAGLLAAFAVPTAFGQGQDLRSPDTRDYATAAHQTGANDPYLRALRLRSEGLNRLYGVQSMPQNWPTIDPAITAQVPSLLDHHALYVDLMDGRSPDTIDAGIAAHTPVVTASPSFQWGDFGIGFGAALVCASAFGICYVAARKGRTKTGPVATA